MLLSIDTFVPLIRTQMDDPISFTISQKFEIESRLRDINKMSNIKELQAITKDLLLAWQQEISRSRAAIKAQLS